MGNETNPWPSYMKPRSSEEAITWEVLAAVYRELAPAADELNEQQRRAAHLAPSFVFVDHDLHRFSKAVVRFDKATVRPLRQFTQAYDTDFPNSEMADCTTGTNLRVLHCSSEPSLLKRRLFGRGRRWSPRSFYQPDNKGDLGTTWVTIMVLEDHSPILVARPATSRQTTQYSGDLAGWQKLLHGTGYAPLVDSVPGDKGSRERR